MAEAFTSNSTPSILYQPLPSFILPDWKLNTLKLSTPESQQSLTYPILIQSLNIQEHVEHYDSKSVSFLDHEI